MAIVLYENFRALFYAPFYAAEAIGAYRAAGVEVEFRNSPDPASTGAALRSGQADVMWGGPLRVLMMAERDPEAEFVCVCNVVERDPFFIIGRTPHPDFTLPDLVGERFASVSEVPTPWLCLQDDLRRAGVDPGTLDRTSGPSMAENAQALRDNKLDAAQMFQPYAEQLIREGVGYVWQAAADRGLTAYTTLVTRRSVLRERPGELQAMIAAMARTLRWFDEASSVEIARVVGLYFPKVEIDVFAACIDRYKHLKLWASTPVLAAEGFDRLQEAMLSGGALSARFDFDTCVDNTLAQAVL